MSVPILNHDDERLKEYKEAFGLFDKNGDGTISVKEFATVIRSLGINPSPEEVKKMVEEIDANHNKIIEFNEFVVFMENKMKRKDSEEDMIEIFKVFDADGDGLISRNELKNAMDTLGAHLTEKDVNDILDVADEDNDGYINYSEFIGMINFNYL